MSCSPIPYFTLVRRSLLATTLLSALAAGSAWAQSAPAFTLGTVTVKAGNVNADMAPILACALEPRCEYCDWWRAPVMHRSKLAQAAAALEARGVQRMLMVGGSRDGEYDDSLVKIVQSMREAGVKLAIEINVGGSLSAAGLARLKPLGVVGITASLETVNEALFLRHKPGDSLAARRGLLAAAQAQGFEVRSIMMMGMGESVADRIDHLLELRSHTRLRHLMISRFDPKADTPLEHQERVEVDDWARTIAMARLLLPQVRIGFGGGMDHSSLALWWRAGGGNQLFTMGVHTMAPPPALAEFAQDIGNDIHLVDRRALLRPSLERLGLQVGFDDPDVPCAPSSSVEAVLA